jgi:hypothetical protein
MTSASFHKSLLILYFFSLVSDSKILVPVNFSTWNVRHPLRRNKFSSIGKPTSRNPASNHPAKTPTTHSVSPKSEKRGIISRQSHIRRGHMEKIAIVPENIILAIRAPRPSRPPTQQSRGGEGGGRQRFQVFERLSLRERYWKLLSTLPHPWSHKSFRFSQFRKFRKISLPFFYANLYKIPGISRKSVTFLYHFSTYRNSQHILHTAEKLQDIG